MECIKNSDCQEDEFCNDIGTAGLKAANLYQCKKTSQPNDPCKDSKYCPTGYGCHSKEKKCRQECIAGSSPSCILDPVENKNFKLYNECTSSSECGTSDYCVGKYCLNRMTLNSNCYGSASCAEGLSCGGNGFCKELCSAKHSCKTGFYCKYFDGEKFGICDRKDGATTVHTGKTLPLYVTILIVVGIVIFLAVLIGVCILLWVKRRRRQRINSSNRMKASVVFVAPEPPNNKIYSQNI